MLLSKASSIAYTKVCAYAICPEHIHQMEISSCEQELLPVHRLSACSNTPTPTPTPTTSSLLSSPLERARLFSNEGLWARVWHFRLLLPFPCSQPERCEEGWVRVRGGRGSSPVARRWVGGGIDWHLALLGSPQGRGHDYDEQDCRMRCAEQDHRGFILH